MSKRTVYVVVGLITVVVAAAAAYLVVLSRPGPTPESILAAYRNDTQYSELTIDYPLDETLFPPEIAPPIFRWTDGNSKSDTWLITIDFEDDQGRINKLIRKRQWAPEASVWEAMKSRSLEKDAKVTVIGAVSSGARTTTQPRPGFDSSGANSLKLWASSTATAYSFRPAESATSHICSRLGFPPPPRL